ncbi:DUF4190 domain-containing protein [Micromonospora sagamiensis]|uniref:Uncharacterized protein DUF4190 n=1 Tax=Micromonospora sagamiensis TaxID=47875 RepID=A0A562WMC1_9ACTN|nr:DUF4190 domain-containing protein [Micromonospora sagamiensis]TWJ31463.1 uncharacterized protein DUF4190 [Micromonospora sagamiensis]BCL15489.1 hypothetical protein GCM10017556_32280 [Micromonospora sagamiensis]
MTYPSPSQWQDPARSDPSSAPPVDPYAAAGYPAGYAAPPGYPVPPAGYAPYPYPPVRQTNSLALVSLILSVMGVASCVTAPIGAILGHVARRQIRERGEDGDGLAKAGIIVGWVLTGLIGLAIVAYIALIVFAVSQSDTTY